jgi:hypothetical protein
VDSRFSFLTASECDSLDEILTRRSGSLLERIRQTAAVTQSQADDIVAALSEEFIDNVDDDWEPTDYGRHVSALMARFNAARIAEWP